MKPQINDIAMHAHTRPELQTACLVNDIHSQTNLTRVSQIFAPASIEELIKIIQGAKVQGKSISIAGGWHAMGGQQFSADNVLIDMSKMNRVLRFMPGKNLIEAEAGIRWNELIDYTTRVQERAGEINQVGIAQKQTGADCLSIGGSLAANIHGRGLKMKPLIADIESFTIIDADGRVSLCSRQENAELFCLTIGGYGLFGIVSSVTLRLKPRLKLKRVVEISDIRNLPGLFAQRIDDGFLYGDFQFAIAQDSDDFLRRGVFSCYLPVSIDQSIEKEQKELCADDWKALLYLAHTDKPRAFDIYSEHYLNTNGQIYWSDTHQLSVYLNDYHKELDARVKSETKATEMITEVYVPRASLPDFMETVREDFRRNNTDLIYGTIRLIEKDDESFLAWAREDFACIVFNLCVKHDESGFAKARKEFRFLIDRAIQFGGSFYLTYHRWASREQLLHCYPQFLEFLTLKKRYDVNEIFQSDWYRHYRTIFCK